MIAKMKKFPKLILAFSIVAVTAHAANILDLDKDRMLNDVPVGTEIRVKLPQNIIDKDLTFAGGELYRDTLYFDGGKLESLPDKSQNGVVIHQKSPAAGGVLCDLGYMQYSSPKIVQKEPELVLIVEDSNRVVRRSSTGTISSVVLDTLMSQTTSLHFAVAVFCQSGSLRSNFSNVTVGDLVKSFGSYLVRK